MNTNISPQTTKNSYNVPDYGFHATSSHSSNTNANMNININITDPMATGTGNRGRFQTQQIKGSDLDIFLMGVEDNSKKSSPYMRKEAPHEAYEGSKNAIKLK